MSASKPLRQDDADRDMLKAVDIEQLISDGVEDMNKAMGMCIKTKLPVGEFKSVIGHHKESTNQHFELDFKVSILIKMKRRKEPME